MHGTCALCTFSWLARDTSSLQLLQGAAWTANAIRQVEAHCGGHALHLRQLPDATCLWDSSGSTRPFSMMGMRCCDMLCSTCRVFTASAFASTSFSDAGTLPWHAASVP